MRTPTHLFMDARLYEQTHAYERRVSAAIRGESQGRTCGTCTYYAGPGECSRDWGEWIVRVHSDRAVACKRWEAAP